MEGGRSTRKEKTGCRNEHTATQDTSEPCLRSRRVPQMSTSHKNADTGTDTDTGTGMGTDTIADTNRVAEMDTNIAGWDKQ